MSAQAKAEVINATTRIVADALEIEGLEPKVWSDRVSYQADGWDVVITVRPYRRLA